MPVGKLVVDKDGDGIIFIFESLRKIFGFRARDFETGPSVPLELSGFGQAAQATDEATGGHGEVITAVLGAFNGDW